MTKNASNLASDRYIGSWYGVPYVWVESEYDTYRLYLRNVPQDEEMHPTMRMRFDREMLTPDDDVRLYGRQIRIQKCTPVSQLLRYFAAPDPPEVLIHRPKVVWVAPPSSKTDGTLTYRRALVVRDGNVRFRPNRVERHGPFVFVRVSVGVGGKYHALCAIVDTRRGDVEVFDPLGHGKFTDAAYEAIQTHIDGQMLPIDAVCPRVNFQRIVRPIRPWCIAWVEWYIRIRKANPDTDRVYLAAWTRRKISYVCSFQYPHP